MADGRVGVPATCEELCWAWPHERGVCRDGARGHRLDIESACEQGAVSRNCLCSKGLTRQ
jgi:hypothetical protein